MLQMWNESILDYDKSDKEECNQLWRVNKVDTSANQNRKLEIYWEIKEITQTNKMSALKLSSAEKLEKRGKNNSNPE
jgi:hypothetical protein